MNSRVYFKYENVLYGIYVKVNRNISEREYILKNSKDSFYLYYR